MRPDGYICFRQRKASDDAAAQSTLKMRCASNKMIRGITYSGENPKMPDNVNDRRRSDRSQINVNEKWELDYWAKELRVSQARLKTLVREYGGSVSGIRKGLDEK